MKKKRVASVLKKYDRFLGRKIIPSKISKRVAYLLYRQVGLSEEVGEIAGKLKRIVRDKKGRITKNDRLALAHELGDVLWYLGQIGRLLGYTMKEIMKLNTKKLSRRIKQGKLRGSGDKR